MALDWVGEGGSSIVGWVGLFIVGSGIGYLWGLGWGRGKTTSGAKQPVCVWGGGGGGGGGGQQLPLPLTRGWSYPD